MLHVETVGEASATGRGLLLHGAFGRGRNLRSLAVALAERRPGTAWLLPDLRGQGASPPGEPPQTLDACAADLAPLGSPQEVIGHSLGGKIALAVAARQPPGLERVVVIDADPGRRAPAGEAWEMLDRLRALPAVFPSREAAVRAVEASGVAPAVAHWLATSLRQEAGTLRFPWDLQAMEALLRDYFAADLWPVVEAPEGPSLLFVKASRSEAIPEASVARIGRASRAKLVVVEGGHWLHVDAPKALLEAIGSA